MNLQSILGIGVRLQFVKRAQTLKQRVHGESRLLDNLKWIVKELEELNISSPIEQINAQIKYLKDKYKEDEVIDNNDAKKLFELSQNWFDYIYRVLSEINVYKAELESGLDIRELKKLSNNEPCQFIIEEIWNILSEIEKSDYSDAAKCLILNTPTPSVMVSLRGAESSVGKFYEYITENEVGKMTWRQMTKELKDNAESLGIKDNFIGYLDYYGDAKRNLAQHPNKIYTSREAVMIFMQVMAMVEEIYTLILARTS